MKKLPKLIVVLGPTAIGKSDIAVEIAIQHKGEVVSADSRQVYTGLNIGSGKITKKEMLGIPHHCLDIVSPKKVFTVADFQKQASRDIQGILKQDKTPVLCGGTGFYIDSIIDGIVLPEVKADPTLRKKLETYSTPRLLTLLKKLDPKRLKNIDQQNRVRIIRSIEIAKTLGKVPTIKKRSEYDLLIIGLDTKDEILKNKIHTRILARLKKGMIQEAVRLHEDGVSWKRMRQLGLEYGLLADLIQKKLTRAEFIERLSFDTWHYVKRQRTWFKKDPRVKWFDPEETKKIHAVVGDFILD